jgi:hypothetical protein
MTMIAYAFLHHRRLAQAARKKKNQRTSTSAKPAGRTPRSSDSSCDRRRSDAHTAENKSANDNGMSNLPK